jgi:hypothetical protein
VIFFYGTCAFFSPGNRESEDFAERNYAPFCRICYVFALYRVNCTFSARAPRTTPKKGQINSAFSSKLQKFSFLSPAFVASAYFRLLHKLKFPGLLPPFFLLFQLPLYHQLRPVSHTHSIPSSLLLARLSRPSVTSPYYPSVSSLHYPSVSSLLSLRLLSTVPPSHLYYPSASARGCAVCPPSLFSRPDFPIGRRDP